MISYTLAPIPIWCLRDNAGFPLAGGKMFAYRDTNRSEEKAVYQDSSGLLVYTQPIIFNAAGFEGPFYWAEDENYYLEIYDINDQLVKTIPAYNGTGGGSGPVTNEIDFTNFIYDSQFRYARTNSFTPVAPEIQIGASNWFLFKNNNSATDQVLIEPFSLGSTNPPNNPQFYLRYSCTVPGSLEPNKDLLYRFQSVYSFQGQEVTFGFYARAPSGNIGLEVAYFQIFGSGGAPSATVGGFPLAINLTPDWEPYQITFVVPSVGGKTLGSNGDDALFVGFRYNRDATTTIDITNVQLNLGTKLLPFDYLTPTNNATLQIPFFWSERIRLVAPFIDEEGRLGWTNNISFVTNSTIPMYEPPNPSIINWFPVSGFRTDWFIGGGVFRPTHQCVVIINFSIKADLIGGAGAEVQIQAIHSGYGRIASQSGAAFGDGQSFELTLTVLADFTVVGQTLHFEFLQSGTSNVRISPIFIKQTLIR